MLYTALTLLATLVTVQGTDHGVQRLYLDQGDAIERLIREDVGLEGTKEEQQQAEEDMQHERLAEEKRESLDHQEGPEEEEELEEFTDVDFAESLMLLGGVAFVMTLFYLVNAEDPDMRFYSWRVISATLSIFSAVLIFSGINKLIHAYLLPHGNSPFFKFLWSFVAMLTYFLFLQLGTAYESGAFNSAPSPRLGERKLEALWVKMERHTRSLATILAHMTGFASMHCGTVLQHLPELQSPAASFIAAPVMFLLSAGLNWLARRVRETVTQEKPKYQPLPVSEEIDLSVSEEIDLSEWSQWTYDLWTENVIEAEHDAAALSVSFLVVQSCRFAFSGELADELSPGHEHKQQVIEEFASFSLVFALLTVVLVVLGRRIFKGTPSPGTLKSFLRRCWILLQLSSAMAFAWTLLFSSRWEIGRFSNFVGPPASLSSRISLALGISFFAALVIRMLDFIVDMDATEEAADEALGHIISSLGILVGFSWEQSFDGGVEVVALRTYRPLLTQLALACCVVALILPAWRRHILEKVLSEEKKRATKAEPGGSRSCIK